MIHYEIDIINPHAHLIRVRMLVLHPDQNGQKLSLPTWIPGSYLIRDFSRHIVTMQAYQGQGVEGAPLAITKINACTWQCAKNIGAITIEYVIYGFDTSVRGAYVDTERCFLNGASIFLMAHGEEKRSHQVHLRPHPEQHPQTQVATTLPRKDAKPWGFGTYIADSYDSLIDHPIEIGQFDIVEFKAQDKIHYLAVSGKHDGDLARIQADLQPICEAHIQLFGEIPPFDHYLFMLHIRKDSYGGLEHRSSTACQIQRESMPLKNDPSTSRHYLSLLGLLSHEYFHAWNVKRIRPQSFEPFALFNKAYTKQLWIFEGFTSYYDDLALVRSKVISVDKYLDLLAQTLTRLLRTPGRAVQSVADSSFDAWIKFYQPNENSGNSQVSYYIKGCLVALMIDLHLRLASDHRKSLDEIMRQLWTQFGKKRIGVPEDQVRQMLVEVGGQEMGELLDLALNTTQELPLEQYLNGFGLELHLRPAASCDDLGGKTNVVIDKDGFKSGVLGCTLSRQQNRVIIASVLTDSPAQKAGLAAFDEIIALDGYRVDDQTFDKTLKRIPAESSIPVLYSRADIVKQTQVTVQAAPLDTAEIVKKAELSKEEQQNLEKWLMI